MKVIEKKPSLLTLGMGGLRGVNDRVVWVMVGGSPDLVEVNLEKTLITNQALFCLANLAALQALNIAGTEVSRDKCASSRGKGFDPWRGPEETPHPLLAVVKGQAPHRSPIRFHSWVGIA